MNEEFYRFEAYRSKQRKIARLNWSRGVYEPYRKRVIKVCKNKSCGNFFEVIPSDEKVFCSRSCAGLVNSPGRLLTSATKEKIKNSLTGRKYPNRVKSKPKEWICQNPQCMKVFTINYWHPKPGPKYCSNHCTMQVVGGRPTSPKAARGKSGIRPDIDPNLNFYSRWEANFARIMNYLGVAWIFQPKTFELEGHRYTADFYLPEYDTWIEIKNFLSEYSKNRDETFRKLYPGEALILVLKEHYLKLQEKFAPFIPAWEFSI